MEYKYDEKTQGEWTRGRTFRINVLRLLGMHKDLEECSCAAQKSAQVCAPANNIIGCQETDEAAMLEAERMKADAVMEWQRRRFTY